MHSVEVVVTGVVECRDNTGTVVTCSPGTLAGMTTGTKVGIGKAVLTVAEYTNTNFNLSGRRSHFHNAKGQSNMRPDGGARATGRRAAVLPARALGSASASPFYCDLTLL